MNRHMQALNILLIIIFILGAIVETYATQKTKKYSWHFMSFLCFLLVFIISIAFYSKEDFVREIARATELFDALDPDLTVRGIYQIWEHRAKKREGLGE